MNLKFIRKGIAIATLVGAILIPFEQIAAAEGTSLFGVAKQENTEKAIKLESAEEIQINIKVSDKVFIDVAEEYVLISETPDENSDWVGKVFADSVVEVLERGSVWCKIKSGNVVGYVKTETLITGKDAVVKATELLKATYPDTEVLKLTDKEIEAGFTVGETKEEEEQRLAAEEAARIAEERARKEAERRQKSADLVNYAKQFIGNPYVYGGTSLTRGADCSGFVMSVYKHYGISLPHSSYAMRSVGYKVSLSDIQPGDIVCFPGHVGIYAGNGQVVNAINEQKGIGMSDLDARTIITVRRIF